MTPEQQQAANMLSGLGAGFILFGIIFVFALLAFIIYLLWRIFAKAGLSGPLALLILVPFGPIIVLCILAFSEWKVVPASNHYTGMTPYPPAGYPPAAPPSYPPSGYPPQGPTA